MLYFFKHKNCSVSRKSSFDLLYMKTFSDCHFNLTQCTLNMEMQRCYKARWPSTLPPICCFFCIVSWYPFPKGGREGGLLCEKVDDTHWKVWVKPLKDYPRTCLWTWAERGSVWVKRLFQDGNNVKGSNSDCLIQYWACQSWGHLAFTGSISYAIKNLWCWHSNQCF